MKKSFRKELFFKLQKEKKHFGKEAAITLIALVITIIILLILAGVTIATLTGDNGIITKASQASEETKRTNAEEQVDIAEVGSIGTDGKINIDELNSNLKQIEGITYKGKVLSDINRIGTLPAIVTIDGYEIVVGSVPIPKGFYHVEGTTVEEGFVISNVEGDDLNNSKNGNQYVWIPVDGILGEDGSIEEVQNKEKVLLGRYNFSNGGVPMTYTGDCVEETQEEHLSSGYTNTVAKDIEDFINSVKKNGGYYIARFEASEGESSKAESKYGKTIVSNITQNNAVIACQDLYDGVNSDLMNSYAWDTAIVFIQKYGLENYSRQTTLNSKLQKSGESGDIQCNIYDMSSNCYEWTTETYTKDTATPCTDRGGGYDASIFYTSVRVYTVMNAYSNNSFRSILYF